jgi:Restriction endonuclease NotI
MAKLNQPKPPKPPKVRARYSIAEWYGRGFESLSPGERFRQAQIESGAHGITGQPCPFRGGSTCNKKGGVCSLRRYEQIGNGAVIGTGPVITTCPNRFLEAGTIFRWIGKEVLQTEEPRILSQIGFLNRFRPDAGEAEETEHGQEGEDKADFIGRIDNVLVHPSKEPLDWCAVELQAVYFSGKSMQGEFKMLGEHEHASIPFPAAHRRPDWRSSGPKRLLPQLQTKVPTIRTWGRKMAVVIDEAFFESLAGLQHEKYLSNAEIAWFVVKYAPGSGGWHLERKQVVFSNLESSVKSLTGGVPLSREAFERQLRVKLGPSKQPII